jgi:hypothetical protein
MAGLVTFLIGWASSLAVTCVNVLIDCANASIVLIVALITAVLALWPVGSPLPSLPSSPTAGGIWVIFIQSLNWLFPLTFILGVFSFVTTSIIAYALIAPLARWVKLLK